ncbi:MAG: DUF2851 family protein [Capnocytophaga sp.]|nr:DUF2851 family protein [Capnocytophaga sp.]
MINENFLHYIWNYKLLNTNTLYLTNGEKLEIISFGEYNRYAGPDFISARLIIGQQQWAGNVEMHTRSSLWYAHGHEKDPNYGNIILHVVWEHDIEIFDIQGNIIPTLELKNYISEEIFLNYQKLFNKNKKFIQCEEGLQLIDKQLISNWIEDLYWERLEEKYSLILKMLKETENDWEYVFFLLILKNFGGNINGEHFLEMGKQIPFSVIRKELHFPERLEALFFGQLQLLKNENTDLYYLSLQKEYQYLTHKYQLKEGFGMAQFTKLRPANFPTIRISQLAILYSQQKSLFSKCLKINAFSELLSVLSSVTTTEYWQNHYTFGKESRAITKKISLLVSQNIWINTIIPIQFAYSKFLGKDIKKEIIQKMQSIEPEQNSILDQWKKVGITAKNALESQALLQLYKKYCSDLECLRCKIGINLLKKQSF